MNQEKVKIVTLPRIKAVSFYGFGETPEHLAHEAANKWLVKNNLFQENKYRNFGFNNPNPSPGSPNYGYEVWIVPNQPFTPDPEDKVVEFDGGLYATTYCPSVEVISQVWQELVNWREANGYLHASHQWLEEVHNPWETKKSVYDFTLYLPIKK